MACTRSGRGTDGGDSGLSGGADHASVPTHVGTRIPGNEPVTMGISNLDKRDLGRRVDDNKRSTGTDETRSEARDHDGGDKITKETLRNANSTAGSTGMK